MPLSSWSTQLPELDQVAAASLTRETRVSDQDADDGNSVVDLLMGKYLLQTTENLTNGDGLSFLHIVCTRPYVEFVEMLLRDERVSVDCKVNQESNSIYAGYTPLHFAVKFDQREVAELLLARYNANLYEQDARGSTPLHLALECRNLAMLDLLLAHDHRRENVVNDRGLSHFMAACAGYTPLRFATAFDRADTARSPMDRGARETTPSSLSDGPEDTSPSSGSNGTESSLVRGKRDICSRILCHVWGVIASALCFLWFWLTLLQSVYYDFFSSVFL